MQAITFTGYKQTEIIEMPRPALRNPSDAIVLVTTTAIGPWDIQAFLNTNRNELTPGGEFAGIVVETGEAVSHIEIDDLVANTVQHVSKNGIPDLFGSNTLPGGHAEYVRVPDADRCLVKIAVSGEERAVLAGGTAGLGMGAASATLEYAESGSYAIAGCDPIGMTALIALKAAGAKNRTIAIEDHTERRKLADGFTLKSFSSNECLNTSKVDVLIVGATIEAPEFSTLANLVQPDGHVIFCEPDGPSRLLKSDITLPRKVVVSHAKWPDVSEAKRIVTAMQIKKLDLTAVVSHVIPLDEAQEAYEAAAGPGPGVQKILLKP
jgi:threonine dehydrogenase-like Zn-dependent dehydrogenase